MAYVAYPSNLPTPEAPFSGDLALPLDSTNANEIGAYISNRTQTRATLKGSVSLRLNPSQFSILLTFQRITLNKGLKLFTAQWIEDLGYKGYVAKFPNFSLGLTGFAPFINIDVELIPDVRYSDVDASIPSPFPPYVYG